MTIHDQYNLSAVGRKRVISETYWYRDAYINHCNITAELIGHIQRKRC